MAAPDTFANPEPLIRRIYAYVAYRVGDGPEAEDITSETFERALRYRHTFDGRRGEVVPWLIGIARRCIADAARSEATSSGELPDAAGLGDLEAEAMRRIDVAAALAQLDERQRELVALRYGADLTARQIGELVGASTNAIEVGLHRALALLRTVMASERSAPLGGEHVRGERLARPR